MLEIFLTRKPKVTKILKKIKSFLEKYFHTILHYTFEASPPITVSQQQKEISHILFIFVLFSFFGSRHTSDFGVFPFLACSDGDSCSHCCCCCCCYAAAQGGQYGGWCAGCGSRSDLYWVNWQYFVVNLVVQNLLRNPSSCKEKLIRGADIAQ